MTPHRSVAQGSIGDAHNPATQPAARHSHDRPSPSQSTSPMSHTQSPDALQTICAPHRAPTGIGNGSHVCPPAVGMQATGLQRSLMSHGDAPPVHRPLAHASSVVQAVPSSHAMPSVVDVSRVHAPVEGSQPSAVHGLPSSQARSPIDTHIPAEQVPPREQRLMIGHDRPSASGTLTHPSRPQVSPVQGLPSSHLAGTHSPAQHV